MSSLFTTILILVPVVVVFAAIVVVLFRRGNPSLSGRHDAPGNGFLDGIFGQCEYDGIGACNCSRIVATPHAENTKFASHVWLYGDAPSESQKTAFRNLVDNYGQLWPEIARELAALHPKMSTEHEVSIHLRERVAVHVGEHAEDSLELVYEFELPDEGFRGFFLRIDGLRVTEAVVAE